MTGAIFRTGKPRGAHSLPALPRKKLILDALAFQVLWVASILGAAQGMPWLGVPFLVSYALIHRYVITDRWPSGWSLLGLLAAGTVIDSILTHGNLLSYAGATPDALLPPAWILCLWVGLGFSLIASLNWLNGRPVLAFVLFACSGMASYKSGITLGAAELVTADPFLFYGLLGAGFGAIGAGVTSPRLNRTLRSASG